MASDSSPVRGAERGVPSISNALLDLRSLVDHLHELRFRDPGTEEMSEQERLVLDAAWERRTAAMEQVEALRKELLALLRLVAR